MYYRPSKSACRRAGIPRGSVVHVDRIANDVWCGRNHLFAHVVTLVSDGDVVARGMDISGWKLAKHP